MSSNNNGANTPNFASSVDVDLQKGFLVIGIVLAFLTALVVLRFCCVQFIDIVIMRDTDSLIRSLSQTRRYIFPWWHLRTHAQEEDAANNDESEFTMEILLTGLTRQQKQELLSSILASKITTQEDLNLWQSPSSSSSNIVLELGEESSSKKTAGFAPICPICINEIDVGHHVIPLIACEHIFHTECLSQWLSTHTRDCPYCRTEIITQEMLEEGCRLRNSSLSTSSTTTASS